MEWIGLLSIGPGAIWNIGIFLTDPLITKMTTMKTDSKILTPANNQQLRRQQPARARQVWRWGHQQRCGEDIKDGDINEDDEKNVNDDGESNYNITNDDDDEDHNHDNADDNIGKNDNDNNKYDDNGGNGNNIKMMTKTTMKTTKQTTNERLSPKNESVLLFSESDGGTKTWRSCAHHCP